LTLAPVACPGCGETRPVTDRQARRVRRGESDGACWGCRYPAHVLVTDEIRAWAKAVWDAWTDDEKAEVAYALTGKHLD
jgi:hypothetical protein